MHHRAVQSSLLFASLLMLLPSAALAESDCTQTTTLDDGGSPLIPLDQAAAEYIGFGGHRYELGLYGAKRNTLPAAHRNAGISLVEEARTPRHGDGALCDGDMESEENSDCRFVFLSISMSNGAQEWAGNQLIDPELAFVAKAHAQADLHPDLAVVNASKGGVQAQCMSGEMANCDPGDPSSKYHDYWDRFISARLSEADLTAEQVSVLWLKLANHDEQNPDHVAALMDDTVEVLRIAQARFPNARIAYLSSRSYGGYAPSKNNEPFAYEQGIAMSLVLQRQIDGDPELCHHGESGCSDPIPWLDWGAYVWANGTTPNSDGLIWNCEDFRTDDGQHPSALGVDKYSDALLAHFRSKELTRPWFLADVELPEPGEDDLGDESGDGGDDTGDPDEGAADPEAADESIGGCSSTGHDGSALFVMALLGFYWRRYGWGEVAS